MNLEAMTRKLKDSNELLRIANEVMKVDGESALTQAIDKHLEGSRRYENGFGDDSCGNFACRGNG